VSGGRTSAVVRKTRGPKRCKTNCDVTFAGRFRNNIKFLQLYFKHYERTPLVKSKLIASDFHEALGAVRAEAEHLGEQQQNVSADRLESAEQGYGGAW
jgi:hypothetical protein